VKFPSRLKIPTDVLQIAETLEGAGYEAWCVGGAIRDTLLGEDNTDYDIATPRRQRWSRDCSETRCRWVPASARWRCGRIGATTR